MAATRVSDAKVQHILRLSAENRDVASIARELDLHRMQVAAILAHQRLAATDHAPTDDPTAQPPPDLWLSSAPAGPSLITSAEPEREVDEPAQGIYVGDQADLDEPVMWDPENARLVQNPHLMIMGESGSGKTYAEQCLVAELASNDLPSIIFDYGQSFERDTLDSAFLKRCNPTEHLIGEEGLALNPLKIFDRDTKGPHSVAPRLADVFDAAFRLGDIQKKVLIDAILKAYARAGITPENQSSWHDPAPPVLALRDAIDDLAADRQNYLSHKNAAGLSARLATFFMLASFRSDLPEWSWDQLIQSEASRVHVLQFRGLEGKTQRVLVELLLWHFFFHCKAAGQNALRVFCVLDEAHHLSFRENGPVNSLLREARKFGLGLIFASQQPEDFSPVAYGNSASKLIFQTADPTGKVSKFLAGKATNYDTADEIQEIIGSLQQGDAFFITRNRGHVVHVADFRKRTTLWKDE